MVAQDERSASTSGKPHTDFGLKVFTDARMPVTHEEGDRYPLGPPKFCLVSSVVEQCLDKALAVSSILTRGTMYLGDKL
jgi:hypothetical protein